ncbi:hypothetical protein VTP01DRAFT_9910 [Rhizomucor pusillus]|uniref:uncharacterized protein n=1 Tax=Rhizomucor pusillus TaxID=4840 RepID=UPI003742B132
MHPAATRLLPSTEQCFTLKENSYGAQLKDGIPGISGEIHPLYTVEMLSTNGIQIRATLRDWKRSKYAQEIQSFRYLPEVRKTRRRLLEHDGLHVTSDANLLERFSGTIGMNLGETSAADRKLKANIDIIEQGLAAGSTRSGRDNYLVYSAVDKAAARILKKAEVCSNDLPSKTIDKLMRNTVDRAEKRKAPASVAEEGSRMRTTYWLLLAKIVFHQHRKGAVSLMDTRLASALIKHCKAEGHTITAVDEYNTSKVCPRCITDRRTSYLQYLRRPPVSSRHIGRASLGKDGNEEIKHVTVCDVCNMHFHRDDVAAHSQAFISASMLEHGQRPKSFIRPSRQLKLNTHPRKMGRALRPCASEMVSMSILNLSLIFESRL